MEQINQGDLYQQQQEQQPLQEERSREELVRENETLRRQLAQLKDAIRKHRDQNASLLDLLMQSDLLNEELQSEIDDQDEDDVKG
ncbi:hypothetical protein MP228_006540 [Amoeboaphelidium protococcarum]|nr:hypothetical protein MP228_006540 [Amoeboaphelidium protococcarum]